MTSTPKQIASNRRNAKRSTGPRTPEGKAAARLNALRHGLTSELPVIPGEDASVFVEHQQSIVDHYGPEGPIEAALVDRVAVLLWRLRRAHRAEAEFLTTDTLRVIEKRAEAEARRLVRVESPLDNLLAELESRTVMINEELHAEAEALAAKAREARLEDATARCQACGAETLDRFGRYETAVERSLYRTLQELRRLQAERRHEPRRAKSHEQPALKTPSS